MDSGEPDSREQCHFICEGKAAEVANGQHVLYANATVGDIATVQSQNSGENSPVISPIGSVVFTVEQ